MIDSDALENSGQIDADFKRVFASEIEQFKRDYARIHGQGAAEQITDAEILREVVNTVGKPNSLGAHVRCVVSVSMLTEGWDANTVTHIAGLRAFGSQLLCEQVAGRALRRKSYFLQGYDKEGEPTTDKRWTTENRWLPAANAIRDKFGWDRWDFIEITEDIRDARNRILAKLESSGRLVGLSS